MKKWLALLMAILVSLTALTGCAQRPPEVLEPTLEAANSIVDAKVDDNGDLMKNRMQKEPNEVDVEPGFQCSHPYECWYYDYCHNPKDTPTNE